MTRNFGKNSKNERVRYQSGKKKGSNPWRYESKCSQNKLKEGKKILNSLKDKRR